MDLTVETHAEGRHFWAHVTELPGCFASGRSLSELREALGESIGLYLWDDPAVTLLAGEPQVGISRIVVGPPERA